MIRFGMKDDKNLDFAEHYEWDDGIGLLVIFSMIVLCISIVLLLAF